MPASACLLDRQRQQQALDGDEAVAGLLGDLLGRVEDARELAASGRPARHPPPATFGQLGERGLDRGAAPSRVAAGAVDQPGGQALVVVEQDLQQMLGRELLVALREREVCADWMKPRARSVYFSKFMVSTPSGPPPDPKHRADGQTLPLI